MEKNRGRIGFAGRHREPRRRAPGRFNALGIAAMMAVLLFGLQGPVEATGSFRGPWVLEGGTVSFQAVHFMHNAVGASDEVSGSAQCGEAFCTFSIQALLGSFRSGDSDRDREMRKAVKSDRFPAVLVEGKGVVEGGRRARVSTRIRLAGSSVEFRNLLFDLEKRWRAFVLKGSFPISLPAFRIEPPSLIGIPIEEEVTISVNLVWKRP